MIASACIGAIVILRAIAPYHTHFLIGAIGVPNVAICIVISLIFFMGYVSVEPEPYKDDDPSIVQIQLMTFATAVCTVAFMIADCIDR